ncbi:MBL fold metallo-hydrolase [Pseudoroseicyclus tamaricis]|uniref:MBL fold metallo-hydrolase n=1 Tax=Pseudoroseicyclus tamaricis TaxID=2705421 RepID=A0A6B2JZZ7_9RHOB|nr:MBL fold metallo-hydrolase [Pseudoroseicyclus tamaricis]NDV02259.1 MBL fold metallo-hydrolase [Pseudoroseicyclus tamaricis]
MTHTRRTFLIGAASAAGATTILPYAAMAQEGMSDTYSTDAGDITVHPVSHASFVMETPAGVIYVDPVGGAEAYADYPAPGLILITHEHPDHYNADTLAALAGEGTQLITNPAVYDMLPEDMQAMATSIGNGESAEWGGVSIDAIPAYNTTEDRLMYHPEGRDNGYVLGFDGFTVYIAGDTEDTPEMRALEGIDLAFLPMNLPYTMTADQAASAVQEFQPTYVYPYHYGGGGEGSQDPEAFAEMVGDASEVKMGPWY